MTNFRDLGERQAMFTDGKWLGDEKTDHKLRGLGEIKFKCLPASSDAMRKKRTTLFNLAVGGNDVAVLRTVNAMMFLNSVVDQKGMTSENGQPIHDWRKEYDQTLFVAVDKDDSECAVPALDDNMRKNVGPYVAAPQHFGIVIDALIGYWGALDNYDLSKKEPDFEGNGSSHNSSSGSGQKDGQKAEKKTDSPGGEKVSSGTVKPAKT